MLLLLIRVFRVYSRRKGFAFGFYDAPMPRCPDVPILSASMSLIRQFVLVLLVFSSSHAEVVDRMVVVVNKQIILQSELEQAAHVEFLLQGKPLARLDEAGMQAVLERLMGRRTRKSSPPR